MIFVTVCDVRQPFVTEISMRERIGFLPTRYTERSTFPKEMQVLNKSEILE